MASQATHKVGVLWNTDCNYDAWIWIWNQASGGKKEKRKIQPNSGKNHSPQNSLIFPETQAKPDISA